MKTADSMSASHVALNAESISLGPGRDWAPRIAGWTMVSVRGGHGYWAQSGAHHELKTGAAILFFGPVAGGVIASQLGDVVLDFFRVEPSLLLGLITMGERRLLDQTATNAQASLKLFAPENPVAVRLKGLFSESAPAGITARLGCLQVFFEAFGGDLKSKTADLVHHDARRRLRKWLDETPPFEMLNISMPQLARIAGCTPRHLSRIFREMVGTSFRDEQANIRLARASELLSTTDGKVVDIALESGYSSLSLFNVMFKRRHGVSPGEWRRRQEGNKAQPKKGRRYAHAASR